MWWTSLSTVPVRHRQVYFCEFRASLEFQTCLFKESVELVEL